MDTNVLVYAVSRDEPEKQKKARTIIERGFAEGCFAAILEAAREAGCARVFSEDLSHGCDYGGVTVENPFR